MAISLSINSRFLWLVEHSQVGELSAAANNFEPRFKETYLSANGCAVSGRGDSRGTFVPTTYRSSESSQQLTRPTPASHPLSREYVNGKSKTCRPENGRDRERVVRRGVARWGDSDYGYFSWDTRPLVSFPESRCC